MSIDDRFESFCIRKSITYYDLSAHERRLIIDDIYKVRDAEKPEGKRLPNLNILTYQICKRLNIKMDEKLLKIPESKVSHDRCRKVFRTLGWEYTECGHQDKTTAGMSVIEFRYEGFCKRMKITYPMLSVGGRNKIMEKIKKVHDAEEPKVNSLPNLSFLTYQICKKLDITVDKELPKIPVSRVPHNRCKKVFQTLGWEYIE